MGNALGLSTYDDTLKFRRAYDTSEMKKAELLLRRGGIDVNEHAFDWAFRRMMHVRSTKRLNLLIRLVPR